MKDKARFIGRYIQKKWDTWAFWRGIPPEPPISPGQEDPRVVGIDASTHCVPCSCDSCCNPRHSKWSKNWEKLTRQEKDAILKEREQLAELDSEE
jgi:hypothetical protein